MTKLEFRLANLEDIPEIITLCNECFDENTNLKYAQDIFAKYQNDPNQIYLIGILANQIIAHTKLTIIPTIYSDMNTYGIINHFCVKPEYRRLNYASQMLQEIERIALKNNCHHIKLWSKNFRTPAHACYKKMGFKIIDASFFEKEI